MRKILLILVVFGLSCKTSENTRCAAYTDKQTKIITEVEKHEEKKKRHTVVALGSFAIFIAVRNYFTKPQL